MIVTVDCETKGLDATQFVVGCVTKQTGKSMFFYKKEDMWNFIIELGLKQSKHKRVLNVYAHHHEYDFYAYGDLSDENLKIYSKRPFIVAYCNNEGKEIIKFLDTMAIYRMSLKKVGELIDEPKQDIADEFTDENGKYSIEELQWMFKGRKDMQDYLKQDTVIPMKSIQYMKDKLKNEGVSLKRIYSINQVAIGFVINKLKKCPQLTEKDFWYNKERGQVKFTYHREKIHSAYRGGRVECYRTGKFSNVDYIDKNSLYPYSATRIKMPNLSTERLIKNPTSIYAKETLFNKIGISRVLIKNESNDIGLLPVRTTGSNYYPKKNSYIIGTYTHIELKKAIKEGYKVLQIEWSLLWDEMYNPFKKLFNNMYNKRLDSKSKFDYYFWKQMMNSAIGKFAQRRVGQTIVVDSVEKVEEYKSKNYEVLRGIDLNYLYKKDEEFTPKAYYAPIIPTLINAYARVYMYDYFKMVGLKNLLYTDTDSIIMYRGVLDKFNKDIHPKFSGWKVEEFDTNCIIYGKKTYCIGNEIKVSGIRKKDITKEDFEEGYVTTKRMETIATTHDLTKCGTFINEARDLKRQLFEHIDWESEMRDQDFYKDHDINNVIPFIDTIRSLRVGR